ncbi:MAG: acyltransferase [Beijerinckiaceae bacterium]|nr:acyltransferase [Beijerinckiaceae bacterium]MCZ8301301.1 acyltransferase [Beijerinckiaceae bacterium]
MESKRYEALDGWRGLAALAITFYHAPIDNPLRDMAGWKNWELFVDFFFVLSGFVIMHAWGQRLVDAGSARDFMSRRFWRIWPLHFSILFAFFGIEMLKAILQAFVALPLEEAPFTASKSWMALLSNITMTQSLNLHGTTTWNGPAWSISVEFWTYLVFAAAILTFRRHLDKALLPIAFGAMLVVAWNSPIYLFATHDFGLFRAIYGFFIGAATYRLVRSERFVVEGGTAIEVAVVMALSSYLLATGVNLSSLFAPLVFAGVIVVFSQGRGLLTRALESRPIQALGLWSYSIYLVHALLYYGLRLVLIVVEKVTKVPLTVSGSGSGRVFSFGGTAIDLVVIAALLLVTIVISAKTYRFIERPFMISRARAEATTASGQTVPA